MSLTKKILDKAGILKSYHHQLNGINFKIPINNGLGYSNFKNDEPWMSELMKRIGSQESTLLDVGVNVGQSLLIWKSLFPDAKYIGFEPNENCIEYVKLLIHKNNFSSCHLEPYGLSTLEQKTNLYLLPKDKGDSSATTIKDFRKNENRKSITVETIPLSKTSHDDFDIAKIDVEGAELDVIKSIFEVKRDAIIVCEILPVYSEQNANRLKRQEEIELILKKNDYKLFRILKGEKVELQQISEIGIHDSLEKADYVFCPDAKVSILISKFI